MLRHTQSADQRVRTLGSGRGWEMSLGIFQSHKITGQIGLEGIFKGHLIQAGHHVPGTPSFHCPRLFQAPSNVALDIFRTRAWKNVASGGRRNSRSCGRGESLVCWRGKEEAAATLGMGVLKYAGS